MSQSFHCYLISGYAFLYCTLAYFDCAVVVTINCNLRSRPTHRPVHILVVCQNLEKKFGISIHFYVTTAEEKDLKQGRKVLAWANSQGFAIRLPLNCR